MFTCGFFSMYYIRWKVRELIYMLQLTDGLNHDLSGVDLMRKFFAARNFISHAPFNFEIPKFDSGLVLLLGYHTRTEEVRRKTTWTIPNGTRLRTPWPRNGFNSRNCPAGEKGTTTGPIQQIRRHKIGPRSTGSSFLTLPYIFWVKTSFRLAKAAREKLKAIRSCIPQGTVSRWSVSSKLIWLVCMEFRNVLCVCTVGVFSISVRIFCVEFTPNAASREMFD